MELLKAVKAVLQEEDEGGLEVVDTLVVQQKKYLKSQIEYMSEVSKLIEDNEMKLNELQETTRNWKNMLQGVCDNVKEVLQAVHQFRGMKKTILEYKLKN